MKTKQEFFQNTLKMTANTQIEILESPLAELEVAVSESWVIMLYNDNVNTFDWVIENLVKYCKHEEIQAEQCAWLVHTKGKHAVKYGELTDLMPVCNALAEKGLSVKLETNE